MTASRWLACPKLSCGSNCMSKKAVQEVTFLDRFASLKVSGPSKSHTSRHAEGLPLI